MGATEVNAVLAKLHQLPAIPIVVQEIINSFNDPDLDAKALGHKIAQDQGLTAKVLRVVNSAFYGLPKKIGSMQDAVVVMGFNNIRSLVLSAAFVKAFPVSGESRFDHQAHWKRSFKVAAYAKALAKCLKHDQDMAFIAGMFHDIGQLMLDTCMQEQFASVLEQHEQSGGDLLDIERSILGVDHALVGAEVAKHWNFPQEIEHAIRYWRIPDKDPFEPVTGIVHIAVLIESGLTDDALINQLPQSLRDRFEISWAKIEPCLPEAEQIEAGANLLLAT